MYSESDHRRIVVIDINKEIIDGRGSMRKKKAVENQYSKSSSDPHPWCIASSSIEAPKRDKIENEND